LKLALALFLLAAGCGGASNKLDGGFAGGGTIGVSAEDMAVPLEIDFGPNTGGACSASTVQVSCGTGCVACLTLAQSGVCVIPCKTAAQDCPTGLTCTPLDATDGGSANLVYGGACGGYDGICQ
jgi:hypothetical protein